MTSSIDPVSSGSTDPYAVYQSQGFMTSQDNFSRLSAGSQSNSSDGTSAIKEAIGESDPDTVPNIII